MERTVRGFFRDPRECRTRPPSALRPGSWKNQEPASSVRISLQSKSESRKPPCPATVSAEPLGDVRCPSQRRVMENDGNAVARELDIELPGVGSCLPCQPARIERVLRGMKRITAMGHHDRMGPGRLQEVEKAVRHGPAPWHGTRAAAIPVRILHHTNRAPPRSSNRPAPRRSGRTSFSYGTPVAARILRRAIPPQ